MLVVSCPRFLFPMEICSCVFVASGLYTFCSFLNLYFCFSLWLQLSIIINHLGLHHLFGLKHVLFLSNSFSMMHIVLYPIAASNSSDWAWSSSLSWAIWRTAFVLLNGIQSASWYILSTPLSLWLLFSPVGLVKSSTNFSTFAAILTSALFVSNRAFPSFRSASLLFAT